MKNLQLIFAYIVGLYVPLISGTGFLLTMTNKKVNQDKSFTTILQSQAMGAAVEMSGLMLLLHGISSGKTELGIKLNKNIIMEYPKEALIVVCLSLFVSLIAIIPTATIHLMMEKYLNHNLKLIIGLVYIVPLLVSYINVGTENIVISLITFVMLAALSYTIVELNKTNVIQIKSLAFIGLGVF
jgi:hypothetical protein